MPDAEHSGDVLVDILRVLERIEKRLDKQDERFDLLEPAPGMSDGIGTGNDGPSMKEDNSVGPNSHIPKWRGKEINDGDSNLSSTQDDTTSEASGETPMLVRSRGQPLETPRIPYSHWSLGQQDQEETDEGLQEILQKYLCDYWKIPRDNRLPLKTFKCVNRNTGGYWASQTVTRRISKSTLEKELALFRRFDEVLKYHKGNDFLVIDYDIANSTRLYRLGKVAVEDELMVVPEGTDTAPWSRLILYQGMATGDSIPERRKLGNTSPEPIPYFGRSDASLGLWAHLFSHLQLKRRDDTTNPYLNPETGFHTIFYEIRNDKVLHVKELWKHGPLYDHPLGWFFRKSAYTLYTPSASQADTQRPVAELTRHWTILLLAPDFFYDENNTSFPMTTLDAGRVQALGHCLGKLTREGAEMNLIAHGLERISGRWAAFQSFFEFILDGGGSLMQPTEHDNLLFDDGSFSRSRRYFWAIDCLSEFDVTISDNIIQWELYKSARIRPLLDAKCLPELDLVQFRHVERQYTILQNQREFFRRKLASTKALRDALFSASAVIESRASTRLGENVKLLTFVSIFFLPLAFCTSLWSINDKFSSTVLIIVIIIVACMTYVAMFNINTLVDTLSRIYDLKKRRIVKAMKTDRDETWKQRGQRFEVFRPKHENPQPSEWYVTLYAFFNPLVFLGLRRGKESHDQDVADIRRALQPTKYLGLSNLFRRRPKPKEPETNDEAWVI